MINFTFQVVKLGAKIIIIKVPFSPKDPLFPSKNLSYRILYFANIGDRKLFLSLVSCWCSIFCFIQTYTVYSL